MGRARGTNLPRVILPGRYVVAGHEVVVERPTHTEIAGAQRVFVRERSRMSPEMHWDWSDISSRYTDTGALFVADEIGALWSASHPIPFAGAGCYLLQYLEVRPAFRGQTVWGALVLAAIASHALALNCPAVVLAAFAEVAPRYRRAGATDAPDLQHEAGLVPLRFDRTSLETIARHLHDLRQEEE